ncbi:MAG: hypothetical protein ACQEWM_04755 [Actinomycetota bacterium]
MRTDQAPSPILAIEQAPLCQSAPLRHALPGRLPPALQLVGELARRIGFIPALVVALPLMIWRTARSWNRKVSLGGRRE